MLVFFASLNRRRVPDCRYVIDFRCSRLSFVHGGAETGLILKCDGDRHEENGFVSNGAGNGIGFGSRGGHGREGRQGAAAGGLRSLGSRLRQRDYERLYLPRRYSTQSQAVGSRLFRAAL